MKIEFDNIPLSVLPNFKGGALHYDAHMYTDANVRIMKGCLVPGASIGTHTHTDSSEVIFITDGHGVAIIDGKEEQLQPGDCHYCPKGATHTLINKGDTDLKFLAVVPNQ